MRLFLLMLIPNFAYNQSMTGNRLIYHEPADSATIFNHYVVKQVGTTYGITPTKHLKYNGIQAAMFKLKYNDPDVQSGKRAEITFPTVTNLNRWYSFAVYFPALNYEPDASDEVINQWHQGGGLTPALCIRTVRDSIFVRIVKDVTGQAQDTWINLGVIEKNVWRSYVMHINHSSTSSGLIEIWRDNRKILDRPGANMYPEGVNGTTKPNWKLGIYKSAFNGGVITDVDERVILFDDIKMGNENCSYREMKPMKDY
jgi:hypothetical protein